MVVIGETFFSHAVVGRLAVLEAFAAGEVGEGEEEVVLVVMVRVIHGAGFADEVVELGEESGAELGVFGLVRDDVDEVGWLYFRREGELVKVLAGDDGGVLELLDVGGGEVNCSARGVLGIVGADGEEGGADAPAGRDGDAGLDGDVADGNIGGVKEELLPLEDGHLVCDAAKDDAVQVSVDGGDAFGDGDVELIEVGIVAAPGEDELFAGGANCGEDYAGDVVHGPGGAVVAGDPLRSGEGGGTGLDGEFDLGVVELAGGVGEVGGDLDGSPLGDCGGSKEGRGG